MIYPFGRGRQRWIPYLLIVPGLFLYFLVALGPSIATFGYSFTDARGFTDSAEASKSAINFVGLENYEEFLFVGQAARDNLDVVYRTFQFSFVVTTVQFSVGLLLALLLNLNLIGTRFFRTLFFMPVILGVVIQGLMWQLVLNPFGGPVVPFLQSLGIRYIPLAGTGAFWWVAVVQIWANAGITMVIFLAGLQTIPEELYEAARIDGAGSWQLFRHVTWPLLTPSVNTNLLLNIIGSLQAWQLFWVLIGYRNGTQVLGYVIFAEGFGQTTGSVSGSFRQGYAAAVSIVLFVLVLIIGLGTQWYLNRREQNTLGAL